MTTHFCLVSCNFSFEYMQWISGWIHINKAKEQGSQKRVSTLKTFSFEHRAPSLLLIKISILDLFLILIDVLSICKNFPGYLHPSISASIAHGSKPFIDKDQDPRSLPEYWSTFSQYSRISQATPIHPSVHPLHGAPSLSLTKIRILYLFLNIDRRSLDIQEFPRLPSSIH